MSSAGDAAAQSAGMERIQSPGRVRRTNVQVENEDAQRIIATTVNKIPASQVWSYQDPGGTVLNANTGDFNQIADQTPYAHQDNKILWIEKPDSEYTPQGRLARQSFGGIQHIASDMASLWNTIQPLDDRSLQKNVGPDGQFSFWWQVPGAMENDSSGVFWLQMVEACRARFKLTRNKTGWLAKAQIWEAKSPYAGPNSTPGWDDFAGEFGVGLFLRGVTSLGVFNITGQQWAEVPIPIPDNAVDGTLRQGFLGRVQFVIWGESIAAWSTRTGYAVGT